MTVVITVFTVFTDCLPFTIKKVEEEVVVKQKKNLFTLVQAQK